MTLEYLTPTDKVACAYCGLTVPNDTALRQHIESCPQHPMSALRRAYDRLYERMQILRKALAHIASHNASDRSAIAKAALDELQNMMDGCSAKQETVSLRASGDIQHEIDSDEVGTRVARLLHDMGCTTYEEVAQLSESELLHQPHWGRVSLNAVRGVLAKYGLRLQS
jgi:DNA-directed RNA polymerase alpha subunit